MAAHEHHLSVTRTARYHTLGDAAKAREAWFVLHGHAQLSEYFIRHFAPLDDGSRLIVAPEALNRFYIERTSWKGAGHARVGATWMTREDRLAEISDYVAYLDRVHARVVEELEAMPALHLLGFSQGAATAARWAAFGAPRPSSLTLWGGLLPDDLDLAALRDRLAGAPLTFVVGDADELRSEERIAEQRTRLREAGLEARFLSYVGGHHLEPDVLRSLAEGQP
jgi:predicted esterase